MHDFPACNRVGPGVPSQLPVITGDKADGTLRMRTHTHTHTHTQQLYVTHLNNEIIEIHSRPPLIRTAISLFLSFPYDTGLI